MSTMSREEMEETIKAGGSVIFEGTVYDNVDNLPSKAILAAGDPAKIADAQADIARRKAALDEEAASLAGSGTKTDKKEATGDKTVADTPAATDEAGAPKDAGKDAGDKDKAPGKVLK